MPEGPLLLLLLSTVGFAAVFGVGHVALRDCGTSLHRLGRSVPDRSNRLNPTRPARRRHRRTTRPRSIRALANADACDGCRVPRFRPAPRRTPAGTAPRRARGVRSRRGRRSVRGVDEGERLLDSHQDDLGPGVGVGEHVAERDGAALAERRHRGAVRLLHRAGHDLVRRSVSRWLERRPDGLGLDLDMHAPRRRGAQVRHERVVRVGRRHPRRNPQVQAGGGAVARSPL